MTTRLIVQHLTDNTVQVHLQRPGHLLPEPAGAPVPFAPPLTAKENADLRWYLEDYLRIPTAVYGEQGAAIEAQLPEWGERLFDALFGPGKPGRDAYQKALSAREPPSLV